MGSIPSLERCRQSRDRINTTGQKIDLKIFHSEILNDHESIRKEENAYHDIPPVRRVTPEEVQDNYFRIKEEVRMLVEDKLKGVA